MKILQKDEKVQLEGFEVQATLRWKASVDLDLHCIYAGKDQQVKKSGFFSKIANKLLGEDDPENENCGHISFRNRGDKIYSPYIYLDKDSGIGDRGGDNEENIYFTKLTEVGHALIIANIFNKDTNFSKYDGKVIVKAKDQIIEVPLTCKETGSWCVVARIDNESGTPHLVNVNKTMREIPKISDFL